MSVLGKTLMVGLIAGSAGFAGIWAGDQGVTPADIPGLVKAFAAGMLYGVHEGWSVDDALTLAHASAAASLRSLSTTGAVEPWRKCLELANEWGWRKAS